MASKKYVAAISTFGKKSVAADTTLLYSNILIVTNRCLADFDVAFKGEIELRKNNI